MIEQTRPYWEAIWQYVLEYSCHNFFQRSFPKFSKLINWKDMESLCTTYYTWGNLRNRGRPHYADHLLLMPHKDPSQLPFIVHIEMLSHYKTNFISRLKNCTYALFYNYKKYNRPLPKTLILVIDSRRPSLAHPNGSHKGILLNEHLPTFIDEWPLCEQDQEEWKAWLDNGTIHKAYFLKNEFDF